ncbi:uncharacterized protein [Dermacentor albipictus]|uniref:uncharacterized protein isoform X2 n=1 Tax=Dermacentor albipictus TaxID=60249 RepID=UPI0038FC20A9
MDMLPHIPLGPHHYEMRRQIMNKNGIHIIYALGRDFAIQFAGKFDAYKDLTVRVFGYVVDTDPTYEHGIRNGVRYAKVIFSGLKARAVLRQARNTEYGTTTNYVYGPGTTYTFAIRAILESYFGESLQAIVEEEAVRFVRCPWSGVFHFETMHKGSIMHLSKHVAVEDPFLNHFVLMEVGTIAHYTGEYIGTGDITVMAAGTVEHMGRPNQSGVTIRISIRKTLGRYIFFPDYGSVPVVAAFHSLVSTGHHYVPRFSKNFSVRQVHMEVFY